MQQGPLLFEPSRPNNFSHSDLSTVALMTFNGLGYFLHSEKKKKMNTFCEYNEEEAWRRFAGL